MKDEKELLISEIESLNEQIKQLGYRLRGLLDVDCNLGVCSYNPATDDLHSKLKEVQDKKALLLRLAGNLDSLKT